MEKGEDDMEAKYNFYFLNATNGKSQKTGTDYYKVSMNIEVIKDDNSSIYSSDFFVDAETYYKVKNCTKFQALDAIFVPNSKGFAHLVSVEPL